MSPLRIVDRIVAGVVALALIVGGVLLAVEIGLQAAGREEPWVLPWDSWYREGVDTRWSDPEVRAVCIGLIVVALLLLALQLARRAPATMPLQRRQDGVDVELDRRGLEHWLEARLARVEGVGSVDVHARRRKIRVSGDTVSHETTPIERGLADAAAADLDSLGLVRRPTVRVHVAPRRTP
jgi:hypothetical protein